MIVDAFGSEPHYRAAVRPVFDALPDGVRGTFDRAGGGDVALVASYNDYRAWRAEVGRPVILMEHGAGQSYGDGLVSYAGGWQRDGVIAFLDPNDAVRAANAAAHPDIPGRVVGTPRLDPYWDLARPDGPVALAWHWDARVVPEARTALWAFARVLRGLARRFDVVGTAHPRIGFVAREIYDDAGIRWVEADEVYRTASVIVADNTSLGWDAVALDRPVVWCNAPSYRRFVDHGLRFWEWADTGINVDEPDDLGDAVARARDDADPTLRARRRAFAERYYPHRDGTAAIRAAAAVIELTGG